MGCEVSVEKFRDYIFKPGATHGKDRVFAALGYSHEHSELLTQIYVAQADARYSAHEYVLNRRDDHGQRISIEIELTGIGESIGKTYRIVSGWMLQDDGSIRFSTPFSGFTQ